MYDKIRIIFTVLSVACVAAFIPLGVFWNWPAALIDGALAALFFLPVIYCKRKQDALNHPPEAQPDFLHPLPHAETAQPTEKEREEGGEPTKADDGKN